jgi:hypothetical protein
MKVLFAGPGGRYRVTIPGPPKLLRFGGSRSLSLSKCRHTRSGETRHATAGTMVMTFTSS